MPTAAADSNLTNHKIGTLIDPAQNPALVLFYTRGTSGLRKRVMPVRRLAEDGAECNSPADPSRFKGGQIVPWLRFV